MYRKIAIILNELDLTYETRYLNLETFEQKEESHTKYNPNGRIPTLIDHGNGDFVIWFVSSDNPACDLTMD